jgi:Domain of unknown function (DUF6766)
MNPVAGIRAWVRPRSLTLTFMAVFGVALIGQIAAGHAELNAELEEHGRSRISMVYYLGSGHFWEATFENWESEFLQMAAFVILTAFLVQRGSPESRRLDVIEEVDADPRRYAREPGVPWPVRRGGVVLGLYEYSLGLAMIALFMVSWVGHAWGGWRAYRLAEALEGHASPGLGEYLASSRFWFESLQNWQSEFLSIAAMVWLSVYLRHRGSPESKPVHAAHDDA